MEQTIPSGQDAGKEAKNGQVLILLILLLMWKTKVLVAFIRLVG